MPRKKIHDRPCEYVIAITGDHVPGACDVDVVDLGEAGDEFVGSLLGDEIAHLAAHEKYRHVVAKNRLHRLVQAIDLSHLDRGKRRGAVDELRVPMPVPTAVTVAQVCPKSVQIGGSGPMGVVLLYRVGDILQRG